MRATELRAIRDPRPGGSELRACDVWRHPTVHDVEVAEPVPGPDDVLIRVRACGVCGSDTHCLETDGDGYVIFSGPARFPCVLGHEYAGEVVARGERVQTLEVGQLVTAEGMISCGLCEACRRGLLNQCSRLEMVGFTTPGAYAELVATPARLCFPIEALAERLGDARRACEIAALVEPVGCSYNGIFVVAGGMRPGAHVAVFGCGPIGLGAIALARLAGAATITAFDEKPSRLRVASSLGAYRAIATGVGAADLLREVTQGWGIDLAIEAAGASSETLPEIERAMAPRGTLLYLGRTGDRVPVTLDHFVTQAARIVGARGHAGGGVFPDLLRLLATGRLDLAPMITARLPLQSGARALERSRTREDAKILLVS
jgi:threonine dehydrogenase-like Zn-dependent dehydrogenase